MRASMRNLLATCSYSPGCLQWALGHVAWESISPIFIGLLQKCESQVPRRREDVPVPRQHEDWRCYWLQRAKWTPCLQRLRYCYTKGGEQKGGTSISYSQRYFVNLGNFVVEEQFWKVRKSTSPDLDHEPIRDDCNAKRSLVFNRVIAVCYLAPGTT